MSILALIAAVAELFNPLPAEPLVWVWAAGSISSDPLWQVYGPQLSSLVEFAGNQGDSLKRAIEQAGNTGSPDPRKRGSEQERRVREMLARNYERRFGTSDDAVRRRLRMEGRVADFVGHNPTTGKWLIAESKGSDFWGATEQLSNTARYLLKRAPDAAGKLELRIYMGATQYSKLVDTGIAGWRPLEGKYLGYGPGAGTYQLI